MPKRLLRILKLVREVAAGNVDSSASSLAEKLDVSRRTLFRDLATLREAGFDLQLDKANGKYRFDSSSLLPYTRPLDTEQILDLIVELTLPDIPRTSAARERARDATLGLAETLSPVQREFCKQLIEQRQSEAHNLATTSVAESIEVIKMALDQDHLAYVHAKFPGSDLTGIRLVQPITIRKQSPDWILDGIILPDEQTLTISLSSVESIGLGKDQAIMRLVDFSHLDWANPDIEILST